MTAVPLGWLFLAVGQVGFESAAPAPALDPPVSLRSLAAPAQLPSLPPLQPEAADAGRLETDAAAGAASRSIYGSATDSARALRAVDTLSDETVGNASLLSRSPSPPVLGVPQPPSDHAASLLERALQLSGDEALAGESVPLERVLEGQRDRAAGRDAVQAYWHLSRCVAACNFALGERSLLETLAPPATSYDQALLTSARAAAAARCSAARLAALQAQQALAGWAPASGEGRLPLPADAPFVGVYRTHFAQLRDRGAAPAQLAAVDRLLPAQHELIESQARVVHGVEGLIQQAIQEHQRGGIPASELLAAFGLLREARRDFLQAVETYNQSIADYALALNLPAAEGQRVVAMLIEKPAHDHSVLAVKRKSGDPIRRVSNEESLPPAAEARP